MKSIDERMFVVLVKYKKPMSEVMKHLNEHREFVERGYAKGIFIASGRGAENDPGIFIGRRMSREAVAELIKQDVLWREGIADYEIVQFHASRVCDALGAMFAEAGSVAAPR